MNVAGYVLRPYLNEDIELVYFNVCLAKLAQITVQKCLFQCIALKCRPNNSTSKVYVRTYMLVRRTIQTAGSIDHTFV